MMKTYSQQADMKRLKESAELALNNIELGKQEFPDKDQISCYIGWLQQTVRSLAHEVERFVDKQ